MRYIEMPEISVVQGKKAVEALRNYIKELETQKPEELTEKQTMALIRAAKGLISSIEAEKQSANARLQRKRTPSSFSKPSFWSSIFKR